MAIGSGPAHRRPAPGQGRQLPRAGPARARRHHARRDAPALFRERTRPGHPAGLWRFHRRPPDARRARQATAHRGRGSGVGGAGGLTAFSAAGFALGQALNVDTWVARLRGAKRVLCANAQCRWKDEQSGTRVPCQAVGRRESRPLKRLDPAPGVPGLGWADTL